MAWRKTSLIDYPGRVAAVLFLPGCNFRCPYCHNAVLVDAGGPAGDELVTLDEVAAFLDRRKALISALVVSGGEPLLHEETPRLAAEARGRGLAVKLDTNGYFPDLIEAVGADYVALDFKTSPSAYLRVAPKLPDAGERVAESLALLRARGGQFEVRITCAPGIVGPAELAEMLRFLQPEDRVILQAFRPGGCLDGDWDLRSPYTDLEMRGMLDLLRARVPNARIRRGS
ncbi:MAG: anaerobic ribonucleoside-triphosphate reductase activating protein [Rectinemataceae bacterium]